MGKDLIIAEEFKNKRPAAVFASLRPQEERLSEGLSQSYPIIGYKGQKWSIRYRGERHTIVRPDDGTPSAYLDVVILATSKVKSKSYYKKYDPTTSDGERPICSSIGGIKPDPDSTDKQAPACALCPRNVFKTDATGHRGKECTDYRRLAVVILPTQTTPIFGSPLVTPMFLRVPPASLNALAIMGDAMADQGYHFSAYVTRITFDEQKAWPEMVFRAIQGLSDEEGNVIMKLRASPDVERIINGEVSLATSVAASEALAAPGDSGFAAPASAPAAATDPAPGPTLVQPAMEIIPPPASPKPPVGEPGASGSGFGAAPPQQTAADVGATTETDADLDARIAALIK